MVKSLHRPLKVSTEHIQFRRHGFDEAGVSTLCLLHSQFSMQGVASGEYLQFSARMFLFHWGMPRTLLKIPSKRTNETNALRSNPE